MAVDISTPITTLNPSNPRLNHLRLQTNCLRWVEAVDRDSAEARGSSENNGVDKVVTEIGTVAMQAVNQSVVPVR
jgi:hypothetical protein